MNGPVEYIGQARADRMGTMERALLASLLNGHQANTPDEEGSAPVASSVNLAYFSLAVAQAALAAFHAALTPDGQRIAAHIAEILSAPEESDAPKA